MREGLLILLAEDYYSYAGRITNPPRVGLGGIQNRGATLSELRPDLRMGLIGLMGPRSFNLTSSSKGCTSDMRFAHQISSTFYKTKMQRQRTLRCIPVCKTMSEAACLSVFTSLDFVELKTRLDSAQACLALCSLLI